MRLFAVSLLGALACGTAAVACPAVNMSQGATSYGLDQLGSVQSVALMAGGDQRLDQCGLGAMGVGQFRSAPDHSFVVTGGSGQDVVLAVTSDCDAAMLVNTPDGQWHFNDDGNGNLDPRLVIPAGAALDGQVDVWIGTFAGGECAATLNIAQAGVDMPIAAPTPGPMAAVTPQPMPMPMPTPTPAPEAGTPTFSLNGATPQPMPQPVVPQPAVPQPMPTQTPPQPVPMPMPVPVPMPAPVAPTPVPVPVPVPAPIPAAICPNPNMVGPSLNVSGPQLLTPQAYLATVGATHDMSPCTQIDGWGYADEAPSFTLYMSAMDGYTFTAETTSDCDPTMILRDAYGQWYFNDDGPNGLQPQLEVDGSSLNGRVDIWVGSFGGSTCQGTIIFRTAAVAPPMPPMGGGCPNPGLQGMIVNTTGSALYSPTDYQTMAGGSQDISACGLPISGFGFVQAQPSFTFFLSGMQEYGRLEIQGEASCDTVMLVRTPDGQWFFDDDSNGNLNPMINLTNTFMLNGRLDIWIGSYGGSTCPATVEMETWYN